MAVEWQGAHKKLGADEKEDFESELRRMGLDPNVFIVEVRDVTQTSGDIYPIHLQLYVTDTSRPDKETWKLDGGQGTNWVAQFSKILSHR